MDFYVFNDFELIYLIKQHNDKAFKIMYDKYKIILYKMMSDRRIYGSLKEELVQEGLFTLYKCIRSFDGNQSFYKYFKVSIERLVARAFYNNKIKECVFNEDYFENIIEEEETHYSVEIDFQNELQKLIVNEIKNGMKLRDIAKKYNIHPSKIYYEFRKIKSNSTLVVKK